MKALSKNIFKGRFCPLYVFFAVFVFLSLLIRTILFVESLSVLDENIWLFMKIYYTGLFLDVVTMLYFAIPMVFYLIIIPDRIYRNRFHKLFFYTLSLGVICILVFTGTAEYFFFQEFGTRFNFIAVDYLIYTHEVLRNIYESYPLYRIFSMIALVSLLMFLFIRRFLDKSMEEKTVFRQRIKQGALFLIMPLIPFAFVDLSFSHISSNTYANELSANGIYTFFAALKNNEIDYEGFYATEDADTVLTNLHEMLREKNSTFVSNSAFDISRYIKNTDQENKLNVVVVIVESLSAEYLGTFGNKNNLTPNLDRLSKEGILFTNIHATGTRTDRGLEAITLSVPPTQGRSIVKRPDNKNMFSWGAIMKSKGYDTSFIYGGYGYFDNMNYFFSNNGFKTVDRRDIAKEEVQFENAWGVCDEDLFNKAIKEFNDSYKNRRPFFAEIMTTSNHRPYTYPDGRVDIPSHTGRDGAVKYTDYAIGKFIDDAKKEPWFKDTVFVIVADHCANSAGKVKLPVKKYEIPLLIYSPAHIVPQKIDKLASQIDIAPTVLGLLNFSYTTNFFGKDILKMQPEQERAFISTYQKLGYLKKDKLVILDVKKEKGSYQFNRNSGESRKIPPDPKMLEEAISYYQGTNYLYKHHLNRWDLN